MADKMAAIIDFFRPPRSPLPDMRCANSQCVLVVPCMQHACDTAIGTQDPPEGEYYGAKVNRETQIHFVYLFYLD